jgi:hypothetical protein
LIDLYRRWFLSVHREPPSAILTFRRRWESLHPIFVAVNHGFTPNSQ